jgi:hypothetical protein
MTAPPDTPTLSSQVHTFTDRIRAATGMMPRGLIAAATGIALSLIALIYASGGRWNFRWLVDFLPSGWFVAAVTFAAVLPDRLPDSRLAPIRRWVLWSILAVFLLPWVVWFAEDVQRFALLKHEYLGPVLLFASGILVFLLGVDLAARLPERLERTLQRLRDRGVFRVADNDFVAITHHIEATGRRWSLIFGSAVAAVVLITSPETWYLADRWSQWSAGWVAPELFFRVMASYVAGRWLGRMAGYGRLGSLLIRRKIEINVVPGHPDGAGGLKPIGKFYLYQSMITSLPAIFLAVWVVLFWLLFPGSGYRSQYLWLLLLAIVFEVLAFILPMHSMHKVMTKQKEVILWRQADRLSRIIAARQERIDTESDASRRDHEPDLPDLVERYQVLEKTPTWPVDRTIRRRFTLHNLGLMLPLVGYLVGHTEFWQKLSDMLKGL